MIQTTLPIKFHKRLRELRKERGLNQRDLAKMIGATQTNISLWETGKCYPLLDHVLQLAYIFNTTTDYLIGATDERKTND